MNSSDSPPHTTDSMTADETRSPREGERRIRVLIADDHRMMRHMLRRIVESCADLEYLGEAQDGEQVVELARQIDPDVVLMDINMPRLSGLDAARQMRDERLRCSIVALSVHDDPAILEAMSSAGVRAYVVKGAPADEICEAIRTAARGA